MDLLPPQDLPFCTCGEMSGVSSSAAAHPCTFFGEGLLIYDQSQHTVCSMVTANAQQLWLCHLLRANSVQGSAGDRHVYIVKPQGGGGGTHSPVSAVIHFLASLHIHPCQSVRGQRLQAKGCGASQGAGYSSLWLSHLL